MAKVYKNMSTLFERVKLGKIDNQSSVVTKTFSNITYFKKERISTTTSSLFRCKSIRFIY